MSDTLDNASSQLSGNDSEWSLTTQPSLEIHDSLVPCGSFFFVVYGPLFGLVCLVGVLGNALSFCVLHRQSRVSVATFLLKALTVSDSLFLVTASLVQIYHAMSMYFGLISQLQSVFPYLQMYAWPLAHIVQMLSVYMMVLVAVNRYIVVRKPLEAQRLCTKRRVKLQMICMTLGIVCYNIPRFFEHRYVTVRLDDVINPSNSSSDASVTAWNTTEQDVGWYSNRVYIIAYENIAYILFVFLLPLLVLVVVNTHLCIELRRASKNRQATLATRRSRDEHNITLVMIVIIIIFIACQSPACVNQILFHTIGQQTRGCSTYERYYHVSNLLITCNSATNFFVYFLFRRKFQTELWSLLSCRKVAPANSKRRSALANVHLLRTGTISGSMTKVLAQETPVTSAHRARVTSFSSACRRNEYLHPERAHQNGIRTCVCSDCPPRANSCDRVSDSSETALCHEARTNGHVTDT